MNDVPTDAPEAIDAHEEVASMTRPADVPEKFWDDEVGAVRIDALVKSYLELERKLGSGRREPEPETLPPLEVETPPELSEAALVELMRDPRYWRQRDPEFIARVTAGFKRTLRRLTLCEPRRTTEAPRPRPAVDHRQSWPAPGQPRSPGSLPPTREVRSMSTRI